MDTITDLPNKDGEVSYSDAVNSLWSDLRWKKLFALFDHQDFNPSFSWISKQIGCGVDEISTMIDGLLVLGLIKRTESGFQASEGFEFRDQYAQISNEEMVEFNAVQINQLTNNTTVDNKISSQVVTLASNDASIAKFNAGLKKLKAELYEDSERNRKDGIYLLGVVGYKQEISGGYDA